MLAIYKIFTSFEYLVTDIDVAISSIRYVDNLPLVRSRPIYRAFSMNLAIVAGLYNIPAVEHPYENFRYAWVLQKTGFPYVNIFNCLHYFYMPILDGT